MNSHCPGPRGQNCLAQSRLAGPRGGRFEVRFGRHGAHTHIERQFVSYPFHMTRPFALDAAIPSLLTVYQQSSSGGLYRAEDLFSQYEIGAKAAVHVTTQAATIVHDCQGQPARQHSEVRMEESSFLALTPDPLVLFPRAFCETTLVARLASGAVLFLSDSFSRHDPKAQLRPFDQLSSDIKIEDHHGRLVVRDSFRISGQALGSAISLIGGWNFVSNFMLLGDPARLPTRKVLTQRLFSPDVITGLTELPNRAGWGVRCLAGSAIAARAISSRLFSLSVEAAFGVSPTQRRK